MEGPPENRGVNFRALDELFRLQEERAKDNKYTLQVCSQSFHDEWVGRPPSISL